MHIAHKNNSTPILSGVSFDLNFNFTKCAVKQVFIKNLKIGYNPYKKNSVMTVILNKIPYLAVK